MPEATAQPTTSETFRISVLDALYSMRAAWDQVTEKTIKNCFRHAGFCKEAEVSDSETAEATGTDELKKAMDSLATVRPLQTSAQDFVAIDSEVVTTAEASVSEIVQSMQRQTQNNPDSDSDEEPFVETDKKVTAGQARAAIDTLRRFAEQNENGDSLFKPLEVIEDKVHEISSETHKQTTLLDFFKKA